MLTDSPNAPDILTDQNNEPRLTHVKFHLFIELSFLTSRVCAEGLLPDATFILDVPVEVAMKRLGESLDRMESRGPEYLDRVRRGFLKEAERWPDGVDIFDATETPDEIQVKIQAAASNYMSRKNSSPENA